VSDNNLSETVQTVSDPDIYLMVKILHSSETQVCKATADIKKGMHVIVKSRYGKDLARVLGPVTGIDAGSPFNVESITRVATPSDLEYYKVNEEKEAEAYTICRNKIKNHKLEMKLISAHYVLDESKILFFFTAESRVDFRELVKDLVSVFKMRIELRQVGVRDESRILGGLAVCGRSYCCHGVTDNLKPVSINMAKEQSLSLNSMKISGPCGRLLCCLSYEFDLYKEEKKHFPREGVRMSFGDDKYKVVGINILTKNVSVVSNDGRHLDIHLSNLSRDSKGLWKISEDYFSE